MQARRYWLMKSEPYEFSIDDLHNAPHQTTMWTGVRNYEARNFMRDHMRIGDGVLFYHSNVQPPEIVGTATVASAPYPDPTQFEPDSEYFDQKSSSSQPRWMMVDIRFASKWNNTVTRDQLKADARLENMALFKRSRLSIQPISHEEWHIIHALADEKPLV